MSPATGYQQRLDRGWLLMDLKNWPLAEREFREAVSLEPQAATPHAALAWCIAQRSVRHALDEAREAVRLEPTLDYAQYTLGHLLIDARDYTAASEAVDEALRLDPRDVNHHALQARLHIAQDHWREALQAADEGLQFSPQDPYCLRWRAIALRGMGMPIMAEKTTAQLLASHPEDAAGHEQHAWALLQQGEAEPAETHFRESLRLSPSSRQALRGWRESQRMGRWWRRCLYSRPKSRIQAMLYPLLRGVLQTMAVFGLMGGLWLLLYLAAVIWSAL
ncbi:MAG: tetratricopeptide repeat protein [Pirellulales bacterium]|nr:tetratricopeptide repeat protein [Pirellulales bacterium]